MLYFWYALLAIGAYLIGNISFAILLSKKKNQDITKMGSGNPGTMNMLRNFGFKTGILTLALDALKGAAPALTGYLLFGDHGLYIAGLAVILGHIYPVFRKFKGGKGVACTLGVFLVANPILTLIFFVVAFIYLFFFDYGAIASFIVVTAMTICEGINHAGDLLLSLLIFAIFLIVWIAHRKNITRLLVGKENKANLKKSIKKFINQDKTRKERKEQKKVDKEREIG